MSHEFVLSPSLKFHRGGVIEYDRPDGTSITQRIVDLPNAPQEINMKGIAGKRALRGVGAARFNVEQTGTLSKERFRYDHNDDRVYRFSHVRPIAVGATDEFGLTYLKAGQIAFSQIEVPFRGNVDGTPWFVDLPSGVRVKHVHAGYLLIVDQTNTFHERYRDLNGQWYAIETGMSEVPYPWVLNADKQFSVKVLDVLELFADGSVCFLNQYQYADGAEIDVRHQSIHLTRSTGSRSLYLYENGELIGSGVYCAQAFRDRNRFWHAGWGFGTEVDLPLAEDKRIAFVAPWCVLVISLLLVCIPAVIRRLVLNYLAVGISTAIGVFYLGCAANIVRRFMQPVIDSFEKPLASVLAGFKKLLSSAQRQRSRP